MSRKTKTPLQKLFVSSCFAALILCGAGVSVSGPAKAQPQPQLQPQIQAQPQSESDPTLAPAPTSAIPLEESPTVETPDAASLSETPVSPEVNSELPALSTLLQQSGINPTPENQASPATANPSTPNSMSPATDVAPPPGFDLPVTGDLEAAQTVLDQEKTKEEKEREMRDKAFKASTQGLMPMKPNEIRRVLEMYDETQQAVQTPIYPNPKPESTFETISLDPGQPPVEIKTAVGHVTTITLLDVSGQPWPIQDLSWAGNFEVLQPENGGNMLRITPLSDYAYGNVSMRMVGLNAPVIMTLHTERKSVQLRADIQIPELGPNGVAPPIEQARISTTAGDQDLTTILQGIIPAQAERLSVEGVDGRTSAFSMNGQTFVRTPYTLLSPAWNKSVRSADGTNVYALNATPVLLLSDKGQMVRAQLSRPNILMDGQNGQ
jgi:intracellular multiplication protein IcmK